MNNRIFAKNLFKLVIACAVSCLIPAEASSINRNPLSNQIVFGDVNNSIVGEWKFYKMSLDGNEMPPRDPRMNLRYSFGLDGTDKLYWSYDEGQTFCERGGQFFYQDGFLLDEINWVNPNNKSDCSSDTDMQLGRKTNSQVEVLKDELILHIPFGDKEMLYFWTRLPQK